MRIFAGINEISLFNVIKDAADFINLESSFEELGLEVREYDINEEYSNLEPWIQWPTVYSGLSAKEHQKKFIGDSSSSHNFTNSLIWNAIEGKWLVVSPINITESHKANVDLIKDPWCSNSETKEPYSTIFKFIKSNEKMGSFSNLMRLFYLTPFLFKSLITIISDSRFYKLGINLRSFGAILLDLAIVENSLSQAKKKKIDHVHFFLNGCAHIQHHFGINHKSSRIISFFIDLNIKLYKKYTDKVFICTGLSQVNEDTEIHYWKMKDFSLFDSIDKLSSISRRMSKDLTIDYDEETLSILNKFLINGEQLFKTEVKNEKIFFETSYYKKSDDNIFFDGTNFGKISKFFDYYAKKEGKHCNRGYVIAKNEYNQVKFIEDIYPNLQLFLKTSPQIND